MDAFDEGDEKNTGRPKYWRLDAHIAAIEQMIRADEIQIALKMLDMIPAWYRQNKPIELSEIKKKLYRQCYDIFLYGNDDDEASQTRETCESQWLGPYCYPRAEIITQAVKKLNSEGKTPWIVDLSCSHGNCPIGLIKAGAEFKYLGKSMNYRAASKIRGWIGDVWQEKPCIGQEKILVCTEALEHAWRPEDIVLAAMKLGLDYDQIFLSTPLGCLGGGLPNWESRPLGHVRGWNEQEFLEFADKGFPGFSWQIYRAYSMVLHGKKRP